MASKKLYVAVAAKIKAYVDHENAVLEDRMSPKADCVAASEHITAAQRIGRDLAAVFKEDNQRFDRARFLKACGLWNYLDEEDSYINANRPAYGPVFTGD